MTNTELCEKKVHMLVSNNYYACIRAVGNRVCGLATKNWKLVTCKNCLKHKPKRSSFK